MYLFYIISIILNILIIFINIIKDLFINRVAKILNNIGLITVKKSAIIIIFIFTTYIIIIVFTFIRVISIIP